jgi:hypothetical protein
MPLVLFCGRLEAGVSKSLSRAASDAGFSGSVAKKYGGLSSKAAACTAPAIRRARAPIPEKAKAAARLRAARSKSWSPPWTPSCRLTVKGGFTYFRWFPGKENEKRR